MSNIDKAIRTDFIRTRVECLLFILVLAPIAYASIQENRYVMQTVSLYVIWVYFCLSFYIKKIEITDNEIKYYYYTRLIRRSGSIQFSDIKKIASCYLFIGQRTTGIKYKEGDKIKKFYLYGDKKRFYWIKDFAITRNSKIIFDDDCAILD